MALLFSHVRVSTPDGNEAEFLVAGIPREFEDVEGDVNLSCVDRVFTVTVDLSLPQESLVS